MFESDSNRKIPSTKIAFKVPKDFFKKIAQLNTPPKNQGVPCLGPPKTASPPREVTRFLLAEKSDNFPDPGDVLHKEAMLMKCPEVQPKSGTFYCCRMRMRSNVLIIART